MTSATLSQRLWNRKLGLTALSLLAILITIEPVAAAESPEAAAGITSMLGWIREVVTAIGAAATAIYLVVQIAMIGVSSGGTSERWRNAGLSFIATAVLLSYNKTVKSLLTGAKSATDTSNAIAPHGDALVGALQFGTETLLAVLPVIPL